MKRTTEPTEYERPRLLELGSLAVLTKASVHGHPFDPHHHSEPPFDPHHLSFSAG